MKDFFVILFFAKSLLLTPQPINLGTEWTEIPLDDPLEAITGGAALYVDVTKHVELSEAYDFTSVARRYPDGTVEGILTSKDGMEVSVRNSGSSHGKAEVRLIVRSPEPMPTEVEFTPLRLRSQVPILDTMVVWRNYKL